MNDFDKKYSDALDENGEKVRAFATLVREYLPPFLDDLFDAARQIAKVARLKTRRLPIPRFGNYPQPGGCRIEIYKGIGFFTRSRKVAIVDIEHSRDRKDRRGGSLYIDIRVGSSSFDAYRLLTERQLLLEDVRKALEDCVIKYAVVRKK